MTSKDTNPSKLVFENVLKTMKRPRNFFANRERKYESEVQNLQNDNTAAERPPGRRLKLCNKAATEHQKLFLHSIRRIKTEAPLCYQPASVVCSSCIAGGN